MIKLMLFVSALALSLFLISQLFINSYLIDSLESVTARIERLEAPR